MGDPAGVGPEIVLRLLGGEEPPPHGLTLICERGFLETAAARLARLAPEWKRCAHRFHERVDAGFTLVEPGAAVGAGSPGRWDPANIPFIRESLAVGLDYARQHGAALVTGPADKRFFGALGLKCAGHTEYLADLTGAQEPVMLFDAGSCRTAVLTRHIPLCEVASRVCAERLRRGVTLAARYVSTVEKGKPRPVAIAGLDPHCGEWGGTSNTDVEVAGWVKDLRKEGLPVEGPYPADTLFVADKWERFGVVICWYHDQGMIPVKLHSSSAAVNVTLGLPVVRAAPAHGVAYDIAGSGRAATGSFGRAIRLARALAATNLTS